MLQEYREINHKLSCRSTLTIRLNFVSITNEMQRYTIFFPTVNALHVSGCFPAHLQEFKNCTCSIGYAPSSPPLAEAVSKLGTYPMLRIQFLSSWWWAEKPPETCRALKIIINIV